MSMGALGCIILGTKRISLEGIIHNKQFLFGKWLKSLKKKQQIDTIKY